MEDSNWTYEEIKELINEQLDEVDRERLMRELTPFNGFFPITSVHRDDLINLGFDVSEVSDTTMARLAEKMANDYCTQLFHISLEIIAEDYFEIPKQVEVPTRGEVWDILKSDFRSYERDEVTDADIYGITDNITRKLDIDYDSPAYDTISEHVAEWYK